MPAPLDETTVRHVAHLARLRISDKDVSRFARQLSTILDYVEQLNELDTAEVEPTAHPLPLHNVFRDDTALPCWDSARALRNAPQSHDGFFRVPKVLDQGGD